MYQHSWYYLKVTIKGFNVDTSNCISVKYNKALNLYFIPPFEQFPSIPAGLLAHVNFICYTCLLLLLHSREPSFKSDLDHWRTDHRHFKVISATPKVILANKKSDRIYFKSYLGHYKGDLGHWRSDHNHFKSYSSHYKSDLGHWRSDNINFKCYLSHYKSYIGYWEWSQPA